MYPKKRGENSTFLGAIARASFIGLLLKILFVL
jgi:hypothetical protein